MASPARASSIGKQVASSTIGEIPLPRMLRGCAGATPPGCPHNLCENRAKPHHTFRVRHVTHNTFLIIVLDAADHLDAEFDPVEWEKTSSLAVSA